MSQKTEPSVRIISELKAAGVVRIGLVVLALFAGFTAILLLGLWCTVGWWTNERAGQFGDAFGVFTSLFNALAFAALVATVVLQSKDLREQATFTQRLEDDRMRPFIKAEWHPVKSSRVALVFEYRLRNVGLGVAVVKSIDLYFDSDFVAKLESHDLPGASDSWETVLKNVLRGEYKMRGKHLFQFNDLNRALAPLEYQALTRVAINRPDKGDPGMLLRKHFRPVIRFESIRGEQLDTRNQFDARNNQR